jgi:hypothetical protein
LKSPIVAIAALSACSGCANAAKNPSLNIPCTLPGGDTQRFSTLDAMAPRDGNFNIGDALDEETVNWPFHRFIQGGRSGTRWYVWYEYGGIAYGVRAEIFHLPKGADKPEVILDQGPNGSTLCEFTIRHLNDAPQNLHVIVQ